MSCTYHNGRNQAGPLPFCPRPASGQGLRGARRRTAGPRNSGFRGPCGCGRGRSALPRKHGGPATAERPACVPGGCLRRAPPGGTTAPECIGNTPSGRAPLSSERGAPATAGRTHRSAVAGPRARGRPKARARRSGLGVRGGRAVAAVPGFTGRAGGVSAQCLPQRSACLSAVPASAQRSAQRRARLSAVPGSARRRTARPGRPAPTRAIPPRWSRAPRTPHPPRRSGRPG